MKLDKIIIKGQKQPAVVATEASEILTIKEVFVIGPATRGASDRHEVVLEKSDIVEFTFEDNTVWLSNSETIRDVFPEANLKTRSLDGSFEIPGTVRSDSGSRGMVSDVAVKLIKIFSKKAISLSVHELAQRLEKAQLDNRSGVYRLDKDFQFFEDIPANSTTPYLLFLHGTASSTASSFDKLLGSKVWTYMLQTYGSNMLAFQHETLTKSPLENVLDLVKKLPVGADLHLISHSRGGLVGDVLARFCVDNDSSRGFSEDEKAYLVKCNRKADLEMIAGIEQEIAIRRLKVRKFIRVACPASGTTLASSRLDYFFNITFNLIGLATGGNANPVYSAFKGLAAAVVNCKNDEQTLPGLEAMNPESPFLKILNNPRPAAVIETPLMVISGNSELSMSFKALIVIASKLFFTAKNDFIVNTESMYNGARRQQLAQYFFDEGAAVDHFSYFANDRTRNVIQQALQAPDDALIPGFTRLEQGALAIADRNALLSLEGGSVFKDSVTGNRPIAVLLPGIMGSNLAVNKRNTWINYLRFLSGGLTDLNMEAANVTAPSLIKTSYKQLADHLSATYDVVTFPFDWRLQLKECAAVFNEKILELLEYGQPIKVIGHSMGGVLVRDFMIWHPDTWQRLNSSAGFRLVFLGSPLGGSFRIPFVLYGKDVLIDKIAKIDLFHSKKELLEVFSSMPGLLSLLPVTSDTKNDFSKQATWKKMSAAMGDANWPTPSAEALKTFGEYRDKIVATMPMLDFSNAVYVAGKDKATPCGYEIDDNNNLVFMSTGEGDQSVTWATGIPGKMVEQSSVYYVDVSHGALSCEPTLFKGISDILSKGSTNLFRKTRPSVRGTEIEFVAPEVHDFDISPEGVERSLLGLESTDRQTVTSVPLNVTISNGDLKFSTHPLLVGHFLNDGILYAERAVDYYLHGALTQRHQLGLYPGQIGSSEIMLPSQDDFNGAIIVGLGKPGELTAYQLTQTIEQGVSRYLLHLNSNMHTGINNTIDKERVGLSSLCIGCGYGGLSIESSVRAILLGVQNANGRIQAMYQDGAVTIQHVEFVEQYEDRSLSIFYSLNAVEKDEDAALNIVLAKKKIRSIPGAKKRLPFESNSEWWTRITVSLPPKTHGDASVGNKGMIFNISTGGAREEQRELKTSRSIINELVAQSSVNNAWTPDLAKTIFELLVPNDFKEQLKKQNNICWIVDEATAAYPWELLQDKTNGAKPLSINSGMVRQLATQNYRLSINSATTNNALVVGDPDLKGYYNQLDGAREEAIMVAGILEANAMNVTSIINGQSAQIIQALFSSDYKIIHLAGHGLFNEDPDVDSGMLIGNGVFLSTREIAQMSTVPDFVFVNCCHLGKIDASAEDLYQYRYKLAANIGTQLIGNGVKAVIAAGWAVDDAAALEFTRQFYMHMYSGYEFGRAILEARQVVFANHPNTNTWGAYQCYGDQFYTFKKNHSVRGERSYIIREEALVDLANLLNKVDIPEYTTESLQEQLEDIIRAVDQANLRNEQVTEAEAIIYGELGRYGLAVEKFRQTIDSEQAGYSFSTLEKYCNIRARHYLTLAGEADADIKSIMTNMQTVLADLQRLLEYAPTCERYNLMGNAYKRMVVIARTKPEKQKALKNAAGYYYYAYQRNKSNLYAVTNWMVMECLLVLLDVHQWAAETTIPATNYKYQLPAKTTVIEELTQLMESLKLKVWDDIDYYDMVAIANIKLALLLIKHPIKKRVDARAFQEVREAYEKVWTKAGSKRKKLTEIEHLELLAYGMDLAFDAKDGDSNNNPIRDLLNNLGSQL